MEKRAYHYTIDTEGKLWQEGYEFDDPTLLLFFFENMERKEDGSLEVLCQGEHCIFHPQDVPYVVQQIEILKDHIQLIFPGAYQETLDVSTLEIGKENVLYCKVRNSQMTARFNRKTYWEISQLVEWDEEANLFYLVLNNKRSLISYPKAE